MCVDVNLDILGWSVKWWVDLCQFVSDGGLVLGFDRWFDDMLKNY